MIIRPLVSNFNLHQLLFLGSSLYTRGSLPVELKVVVVLDAAFRCVCVYVLFAHRRSQYQMTTRAWTLNIG